jgi:outer membrane protein TolC
MIRRLLTVIFLLALGIPASAQSRLGLAEAIARARAGNLDALAALAGEREAGARRAQARAAYFPKVDVSETWQRGNQPVFVFSSLLAARRFTADNFAIDALNRPDAVDNFRTALTVEQPILNLATPINARVARLEHESSAAAVRVVHHDLAVAVAEAYGQVLTTAASKRAAAAALETAEASRVLAANRVNAGVATDADILQVDVHLAEVRQRQIQADADERVARARLNRLMGEPLETVFVLDPMTVAADPPADALTSLERTALENRPEIRLAAIREQLAQAARDQARAQFVPEIAVQAGWETNGSAWHNRSASWVVGAVARVNLFRGFGDRARLAEARETVQRRAFERQMAETTARLDVHVALTRFDAARGSLAAGRAAVAAARESHRIIRDRYEAGLTDIVSLLRAAEAIERAEETAIAAEVGVMVAAAGVDRALGR